MKRITSLIFLWLLMFSSLVIHGLAYPLDNVDRVNVHDFSDPVEPAEVTV